MGLGRNIRTLRQRAGMTQVELGKALGVGATSVSNWERDDAEPLVGRVRAMAELFGVSIDELDGRPHRGHSTAAEPGAQYASDATAPFYGRIAANTPLETIPVQDELWIPRKVRSEHPSAFYLRVKGESMNRVLPDGVYALVDPDAEYVDGAVMAVSVGPSDAVVKRVFVGTESTILAPDSFDSRFDEQRFTDSEIDEVRCIGRVVWWIPPYDTIVSI